jgi:hypothetical protein
VAVASSRYTAMPAHLQCQADSPVWATTSAALSRTTTPLSFAHCRRERCVRLLYAGDSTGLIRVAGSQPVGRCDGRGPHECSGAVQLRQSRHPDHLAAGERARRISETAIHGTRGAGRGNAGRHGRGDHGLELWLCGCVRACVRAGGRAGVTVKAVDEPTNASSAAQPRPRSCLEHAYAR